MSSNLDSIKSIKGKILKSIEFVQEKDDSIINKVRLNFGTSSMDISFYFHPKEIKGRVLNISELNFIPAKAHMPFDIDSIEPIQVRMIDERIKSVSARYQSFKIQNDSFEFCSAITINCEFRKYEIYKASVFDNKVYVSNVNDNIDKKTSTKELVELYKSHIPDPFSLIEKIKQ